MADNTTLVSECVKKNIIIIMQPPNIQDTHGRKLGNELVAREVGNN